MSQELIDHLAMAAERGVVQRRAGVVEAGRDQVQFGAVSEQEFDDFGASPCGGVDQGIAQDLPRVAPVVFRDRRGSKWPFDLTSRRGQGPRLVEARRDYLHVSKCRGCAEVRHGCFSRQEQRYRFWVAEVE